MFDENSPIVKHRGGPGGDCRTFFKDLDSSNFLGLGGCPSSRAKGHEIRDGHRGYAGRGLT